MRRIDRVTKYIWLLFVFCLCGCSAEVPQEAEVEITPSPYAELCGIWTDEYTGTVVWDLRDDGTAVIPITQYNGYERLGGYGTWMPAESADCLSVQAGADVELRVFEEDGFVKLWCEELKITFVRAEEQSAARSAKYVDVTLTTENLWEYCSLEQVASPVDENGERIYKQIFVMRNPLYDQGLVYWDDKDIDLEFVYWTTYRLQAKQMPYGVNFYVNSFNSVSAKGTITFVKADHVREYSYRDNCRTVVLASGETKTDSFGGIRYEEYPY